jgi:hypothetical protein
MSKFLDQHSKRQGYPDTAVQGCIASFLSKAWWDMHPVFPTLLCIVSPVVLDVTTLIVQARQQWVIKGIVSRDIRSIKCAFLRIIELTNHFLHCAKNYLEINQHALHSTVGSIYCFHFPYHGCPTSYREP